MPQYEVSEEQRRFARRLRKEATTLENRLWYELLAGRLDGWKFRRQVPIERYIVDFVCFEARLIVEVDGPLHDRLENRVRDAQRGSVLQQQGFRVLRFLDHIALGGMVSEIRQNLTPPLPTLR